MVSIEENAKKFVFLAKHFPDMKVSSLIDLFQLPGLDINLAMWRAENMGWISIDKKNDKLKLLKPVGDLQFNFGEEVAGLKDRVILAFKKLAFTESDLQEEFFLEWCGGYPNHDTLVSMKQLFDEGILSSYTITDKADKKSIYTFFSLSENSSKEWGRKYFKEGTTLTIKHQDS